MPKRKVIRVDTSGLNPVEKKQVKTLAKNVVNRRYELKHHSSDQTSAVDATSTTRFTCMSTISVGSGEYQREGGAIHPKSLELRLHMQQPVSSTAQQRVRLVVFRWKKDNGVNVPTDDDLFESTAFKTIAPFKLEKMERSNFNVLYDRIVEFEPTARSQPSQKVIIKRIPLKGRITYDVGANTGKNHIYFALMSSTANIADNVDTSWYGSLRYTE